VSAIGSGAKQVPPIAFEIAKHRHAPVRFAARRGDKLHTRREHTRIRRVEIVHAKEQPDTPRELRPNDGGLSFSVGAGENGIGDGGSTSRPVPSIG
jgi:hypothetical protein